MIKMIKKNYKNRLRLAKVIVKNKMSRFLWFSVYMCIMYFLFYPLYFYVCVFLTFLCVFNMIMALMVFHCWI